MYSHLNDPFSEGGRRTWRLGAKIKTTLMHFSAYECILLCVPLFFFKDLVDTLGGTVILNFRLYKAIIE